ncbi:MAG: D-aminoacylase [Fimbriimonadaceae bacterium]
MLCLFAASVVASSSTLIQGGILYDGSGAKPRLADIRVQGDRIVAVGVLTPRKGETIVRARRLVVAPGFIDAHSHADEGIRQHPDAESQVRQGITTAVVGQDGGWSKPVRNQVRGIMQAKPSINFAIFSGHAGIRERVMGKGFERVAKQDEILRMATLVEDDMKAGALGLSTGLEYNPGYFASTVELVALARVASRHGGMYISHVRDETNGVFDSFAEVADIARKARLPAQISHIKMAVSRLWGKAGDGLDFIDRASGAGLEVNADVYPYLFWQSTIRVLTNSRDWGDRKVWEDGLRDVGGGSNVRLTRFTPDPTWEGRTLAQISDMTGKDAVSLIMEIIDRTKDGKGSESIVCTSMTERDLQAFIRHPKVMFCSDGSIGGSHPRGAGAFPRILGRYVRDLKVLSLQEAIRKMTSLPARRFKLGNRGLIKKGMTADIVVFDPKTIRDTATPARPTSLAVGVVDVFVNGRRVLKRGKMTGERGGHVIRRGT